MTKVGVSIEEMGVEELRRAVVNDPRNAELRYLLGAEMAQQKDYDGAVMELSAAVALNPLLHYARFQLGLLHLTMGRADHATTVLSPLENLDDTAALKHFKRGLDALVRDDVNGCVANLRAGIELNRENEPLNRDMTMLMERVIEASPSSEQLPQPHVGQNGAQTSSEANDALRTDFSLYSTTKN